MTTTQNLDLIWRTIHRDYRGVVAGRRSILVLRDGVTVAVFLDELTDAEIEKHLPKASHK